MEGKRKMTRCPERKAHTHPSERGVTEGWIKRERSNPLERKKKHLHFSGSLVNFGDDGRGAVCPLSKPG